MALERDVTLFQIAVVGEGLGDRLDAGEGRDVEVGGLGGVDVRQEFPVLFGLGQEVVGGLLPPEEGAGAVQTLGLLVHGEADTRTGEETGVEAMAEQHPHVHELLELEGLVGGGGGGSWASSTPSASSSLEGKWK
ncbi:hypothetical protein ACN24K_31765 [Streptomyces microflavus]